MYVLRPLYATLGGGGVRRVGAANKKYMVRHIERVYIKIFS